MENSVYLLIPLLCAVLYVFGALAIKRAGTFGVGVWRINFVANWMVALVFVPWWFAKGGQVHPWTDYWQPALSGLLFLAGQTLLFLAINRGDVTVTTPVMGTKVVMVALFSTLLRVGDVPLKWWIGAGLSAGAVALLHVGERHGRSRHVGQAVLLTLASAASYGVSDVLLQKWVPAWGSGNYLPPAFLFLGLYSFAFVPFFRAPLRELDAAAWRWVGLGGGLMAINNAGIVLSIGIWGGATAVNIVYSLRGLASVALVWAIGHWFANTEQHLEPRVLRFRLVGAALMLAAVILVLV